MAVAPTAAEVQKKIDITSSATSELTQLEWINLLADMERDLPSAEDMLTKIKRKSKEQPLIPIGVMATATCLGCGLWAMKKGNSRKQQLFMRGRVLAQGFTVGVMVIGLLYTSVSDKMKSN